MRLQQKSFVALTAILAGFLGKQEQCAALTGPRMSTDRFVFQTDFGDIEMALYPDV